MTTFQAAVIVFPGSNGDRDLFETFERAGFEPFYHPSHEPLPNDIAVAALPGGFSYGDYWRAGMLASQAPAVQSLPEFIAEGGLVIGICNGFQILVEAGILPGALRSNDPPTFRHRWLTLRVQNARPSPWLWQIPAGAALVMPMAHGEGNYFHPDGNGALSDTVPLKYTDNPNGSLADAAALLDETGRVLGVMPHPERAADPALGSADGRRLFEAARRWLEREQGARPNRGDTSRGKGTPVAGAPLLRTPDARVALPVEAPMTRDALAALATGFGLTLAEFAHIETELGRIPNATEVAVFAGMWSEHCSYKSTKHLLGTLPKEGKHILAGPGSHAGVVDVGEGWGVAFKIESHNHPSAVDPYQGATTGVGGILRDIIAEGARPCAVMDSLCFGMPDGGRNTHLINGVVAGIAGYGNAFGVPNIGGKTAYDARYDGNPLVNALAAGLVRHDGMRTARAEGLGNAVLYVGAATGRDGILGAAFASEELDEDNVESRPHVQVGDPFAGKKLLEACLGFKESMGMVACQDMGACGITCGTMEMAAMGDVGLDIDLDSVPLREAGMTPQEILLSESQERFLFVVQKGHEDEALTHFRRHGVHAAIIGRVIAGHRVLVRYQGVAYVDLPAALVAGGAPPQMWPVADSLPAPEAYPAFAAEADLTPTLRTLLAQPDIASQEPLYSRYDQTVGNRTVRGPGAASAAVLKLPYSNRGFALTITGRGEVCGADPYLGAQAALADASRDLACVGAQLIAITDGLNMASPRDPTEMRKIVDVVRGLKDGLMGLGVPVTGGNVSMYNESPAGPIPPTPMVGGLGVIEDIHRVPVANATSGQVVFLLGALQDTPSFARFGRLKTGVVTGPSPAVDLPAEKRLAALLVTQIAAGRVAAARSVGLGGAAVALAKMCARGGCGAELSLALPARADWALFGEPPAMAWVTTLPQHAEAFLAAAKATGVPVQRAGTCGGTRVSINNVLGVTLEELTQ